MFEAVDREGVGMGYPKGFGLEGKVPDDDGGGIKPIMNFLLEKVGAIGAVTIIKHDIDADCFYLRGETNAVV